MEKYENIIIKFGKYKTKGLSIKEIYDKDEKWCNWYLKASESVEDDLLSPTIRAILKYIKWRNEMNKLDEFEKELKNVH